MAAMKKQPPSLTDHIDMAAALQRARAEVLAVLQRCGDHYPTTSGNSEQNPYRGAAVILDRIDSLRCRLDSLSARELDPNLWDPALYYGNGDPVHQQYLTRVTESS
jgi:hypothetical protein